MIVIFYNDKPVYLTKSPLNSENSISFHIDEANFLTALNLLESEDHQSICFYGFKEEILLKKIQNNFKLIKAAGGVVLNDSGEILFIYRFDRWDLPKGKIEKGESASDAALREVREECGIGHLELIRELEKTYHIYKLNDVYVLKTTNWFLMNSAGGQKLIPQVEEAITEVKWVAQSALGSVLKDTYANIRMLIANFNKSTTR